MHDLKKKDLVSSGQSTNYEWSTHIFFTYWPILVQCKERRRGEGRKEMIIIFWGFTRQEGCVNDSIDKISLGNKNSDKTRLHETMGLYSYLLQRLTKILHLHHGLQALKKLKKALLVCRLYSHNNIYLVQHDMHVLVSVISHKTTVPRFKFLE